MSKIKLTFPDGSVKEFGSGVTPLEIAKGISNSLARKALAARVDGSVVDLDRPLESDGSFAILTFDDRDGKETFWHSSAHIMAQAVLELFPATKLAIGPPIDEGFYYDFDSPAPFTEDDLAKIEKRMAEIVKADYPFNRLECSSAEAISLFGEKGEEYKLELIEELSDQRLSLYKHDTFVDLCRGPHVPSTGRIKSFKLMSVAGAYWRGSEQNKMLQRIYGVSFPDKAQLEEYLKRVEEAKRRDHRKLGKELDLFSIKESVGGGLALWHPKGAVLRNIIETFWKEEHVASGYELVYSPHIAKLDLWRTSGHTDFYKDDMYAPMEVEGEQYQIKPMNCPFHIEIYKNSLHSYRELPIRWAELGTVYRYERSGVLHGLFRVRSFTQDDAHIFCTPDQVEDEIVGVIELTLRFLKVFGFTEYEVYLSTKPETEFVGEPHLWEMAEKGLAAALKRTGMKYEIDEGAGAFYGPKIDIKIKDALKRAWQCTTIQFDFNLPERFGLTYTGADNTHKQPFMIHRAIFGSLERFFAVLLEHYAGAFPLWLAPVQVKILPISDDLNEVGRKTLELLRENGIRAELDSRSEKIGYKIREAETKKVPVMLIIGKREAEEGTASYRRHGEGDLGPKQLSEIISLLRLEIDSKMTSLEKE
ncbi:MAG: threonine--tRNA ligase [candidate division Zixibacteria bacterium]|nr:threonine--tRNA ligase [candidate division Zixibacteria bacterium]MBU1471368.1 threonine--tRNA ligase [candidate division Zixibacteria bacterium]MBU2625485.1 threonine--tRNA ligase [candidate division Zixibacteria bacterium]